MTKIYTYGHEVYNTEKEIYDRLYKLNEEMLEDWGYTVVKPYKEKIKVVNDNEVIHIWTRTIQYDGYKSNNSFRYREKTIK